MLISNPFAELSASIPVGAMQAYVAFMIFLVVAGTIFDVVHKKSAEYFFENWRNAKRKGTRQVGGGETVSLAVQSVAVDILASGEFCNTRRRIAHLLTMYGFLIYVITTAVMVFGFPTPASGTPSVLPVLWYVGAILVCLGGYWFWFFIRVDVAAEGNSPFRFEQADIFVVALTLSATFGLIWAWVQAGTGNSAASFVFLGLYLFATTVLFGSIPWSKFAHMFFKPAAAIEKRLEQANGSRRNLPAPAKLPKTFGSGRRPARNY